MHSPVKRTQYIVYEANYLANAGMRIWFDMVRELTDNIELIWRLMLRDILARYKQSFLGILWAFLTPLVMLLVFVWIKNKRILPIADTQIPYPAFVFLGQIVWLFFAQGIMAATNSLANAGNMLTKINFPRETLVVASLGQAILDFVIRIPLLLLIFWMTDYWPNPMLIVAPVLLLPLLLLIVGAGFFLALLNALFRDIGNAIGILLNLGMFATPVIYPPPQEWPLSFLINHINPVAQYINTVRDLATTGVVTNPASLSSSLLFSLLVFLLGWRLFHLVEPKIAERA